MWLSVVILSTGCIPPPGSTLVGVDNKTGGKVKFDLYSTTITHPKPNVEDVRTYVLSPDKKSDEWMNLDDGASMTISVTGAEAEKDMATGRVPTFIEARRV